MGVYIYIYIYRWVSTYIDGCVCVFIYRWVSTYIDGCVCVYIYRWVSTYIDGSVCVYIYIRHKNATIIITITTAHSDMTSLCGRNKLESQVDNRKWTSQFINNLNNFRKKRFQARHQDWTSPICCVEVLPHY